MTADDDRIRYLDGDPVDGLDPVDQAELDELRALLADPALWAEPSPDLEHRVVAAIAAEPRSARVQRRLRPRRRILAGAMVAAAAVVVAVALVSVAITDDRSDEGVEIALQPTELVPGATGTAVVTAEVSGLRIELDARGLPRRDGGAFYQAWLRNEAGDLVPIGTFHEGEDVVLWAGVSLDEYPTLTITEEVADGDQASSGRRVLAGSVG
jgi:hypothetical protein